MAPFSKPETVLKQAEGLVSVGQTHAALQSLSEMFASKRFRSTPLTSLEPITHRFIELCVELRKGRTAKEGLMQYKNIAQNLNVQSIEAVITRFVQLADAKVRDAQEKAAVKSAVDVDDLEASETPESILLGAVSGDQNKDRTDRALVTPWLKFLWESYRTSLETLKNNSRLETIYQQIAQQAFKFCLKYSRKVEFRRLCETLRLHLGNIAKYPNQPHAINLSDPDTLQRHLDTRFAQLNTSVELELWQEAFRSVEDVHNLLTMAKKAPRPAMMANYYEKLTKIFLMSGNALYHAAAWSRYYSIVMSIGGKSEEELSRLAGQVLVSALAVPVGLQLEDQDGLKGRNARLTALLGLSKMPTRAGLLKDALSRDVLKLSPPTIKSLYNILEVTFDPLTLCTSVAPLLQQLSADEAYAPYLSLLQRALLSRLFLQLSEVYSTVKIDNLNALVKPLKDAGIEGAFDEEQLASYIMGCARRGELNIRVDHKDGSITFVDDPYVLTDEPRINPEAKTSTSSEGFVQPSMAEFVRTRLSRIATTLHKSLEIIEPKASLSPEEQAEKFKSLVAAAEAERHALRLRRALVAKRRELLSELSVRKEKEETSRRAEISRREKEEEEKRRREDLRRKEQERARKEIESIKIDEAKKYAQSLVTKGILKANDVDKLENYDTEGLITIQVAQLEKEKKGLNERLRVVSKRIDHIERAYRKEEHPLLAQDYEQQQKADRETFEASQKARKESSKTTHQEDLATKVRLARMMNDFSARKEVLLAKKGEEFAKRKEAARKKIEEEKEKKRKAVVKAWEEEKHRQEEEERRKREKEEEEQRLEEERRAKEERQQREEEAKKAAEEEAKRKVEDEAAERRRQREADRLADLERVRRQQQREEEAEQHRKQRAAEKAAEKAGLQRKPLGTPAPVAAVQNGGDTWRRGALPTGPPSRPESPAPAERTSRLRVGASAAVSSGGGGWRAREEARQQAAAGGGANPPAATQPASSALPPRKEEPAKDEDGFQTVPEKKPGVWRPRHRQS
ncbi:translation initiation factor eIF3a [Amanita rubescens]|nr:translation initiation factor eIF3a [Amanita rubescens]